MPMSNVRGIISSSNEKFLRFFALVQEEAAKRGKVFFIADCECHDQKLDDLYLSEMSGWLVPEELADKLESIWLADLDSLWGSEWSEYFVFERFSVKEDGTVGISFRRYPDDGEPYEV